MVPVVPCDFRENFVFSIPPRFPKRSTENVHISLGQAVRSLGKTLRWVEPKCKVTQDVAMISMYSSYTVQDPVKKNSTVSNCPNLRLRTHFPFHPGPEYGNRTRIPRPSTCKRIACTERFELTRERVVLSFYPFRKLPRATRDHGGLIYRVDDVGKHSTEAVCLMFED